MNTVQILKNCISIIVPVQAFSLSYFTYVAFFSQIVFEQQPIYIYPAFSFLMINFVKINFCAQVVCFNLMYSKQSSVFTLKLHQLKQLSLNEELKCQAERRHFAFKFLNNNLINSETFLLVNNFIK